MSCTTGDSRTVLCWIHNDAVIWWYYFLCDRRRFFRNKIDAHAITNKNQIKWIRLDVVFIKMNFGPHHIRVALEFIFRFHNDTNASEWRNTDIESKWFMPTGYIDHTLQCKCVGDVVLLVGVKFYDYYYDFCKQNIRLFFVIGSCVCVCVWLHTGYDTKSCIDDFCEMCLRVGISHNRR